MRFLLYLQPPAQAGCPSRLTRRGSGFSVTATPAPALRAIGPRQTLPPRPLAPGLPRTAAAAVPGPERGACAPSRTSSLLCHSCTRSGAAGTPTVPSPSWWTAFRPVWWLTAEGRTEGESSRTFTWTPRGTRAATPTRRSAMPPTLFRSPPRGNGASTPPATCAAPASRGPASASSPGPRSPLKPPGLLTPRPPRQNPALSHLPPARVRLRAARRGRGATSRARATTSACPCLPSARRRTGSPSSRPSSWTRRPRRTDR
uniref:Uncharacterized protein n=1 Tax=Gasterosteus aculeatus TaxID=69293 RepID=G3PHI5_GASAC